jgi:hypothetical protein
MTRKGDWIQTYTGKQFYPLDPRVEEIDIQDIAHALSNICRFTGHCSEFYSVAQHSILVSNNVSPQNALWGLLHDASEAYICDVARPLKKLDEMKQYRIIEKLIIETVVKAFDLSQAEEPEEVKNIDMILMMTEARDLKLISPAWRHYNVEPFSFKIFPMSPKLAKQCFLSKFNKLAKVNEKQ